MDEKKEVEFDLNDDKSKQEVKSNFYKLTGSLGQFIKEVTNIREGTDVEGTIAGIKKDIDFKGHNVWILMLSIFIASIGLNTNSTAVIIGAMLISPLMGPILGVGLSVGTNDWDTLLRSLKSFGIAVAVSLATSCFYFLITPLDDVQPELIARTKPTLLDVFIAIFGGLAGIVAGSRKEKSNVIPGVAIATALMPPLCTAGYGLANGNWNFFFGAFYLFFLNSVFISLSTFIMVRFMRFPIVHFVDSIREKRTKKYVWFFTIIVLIPSGIIFWDVIKESIFKQKAGKYIAENFVFDGTNINMEKITYTDTLGTIEVSLTGKLITQDQIEYLKGRMQFYDLGKVFFINHAIDNVRLKVYQSNDNSAEIQKLREDLGQYKVEYIEDQFHKNLELINEKNQEISELKRKMEKLKGDSIPIQKIEKEVGLQYEGVASLSFGETVYSKEGKLDTIQTVIVSWKSEKQQQEHQQKLSEWLKVRLELDTIKVLAE